MLGLAGGLAITTLVVVLVVAVADPEDQHAAAYRDAARAYLADRQSGSAHPGASELKGRGIDTAPRTPLTPCDAYEQCICPLAGAVDAATSREHVDNPYRRYCDAVPSIRVRIDGDQQCMIGLHDVVYEFESGGRHAVLRKFIDGQLGSPVRYPVACPRTDAEFKALGQRMHGAPVSDEAIPQPSQPRRDEISLGATDDPLGGLGVEPGEGASPARNLTDGSDAGRVEPRPTSTPAPKVRQAKCTVEGALENGVVRDIVRAHIGELRACYQRGLDLDPTLAGRVEIRFVVGTSGRVEDSQVESSTVPDDATGVDVATCYATMALTWEFPSPTDGEPATVVYPFVLQPS